MLTKTMKFVSIGVLLGAALLGSYASPYQLPLCFVVCLGAMLVAWQALAAKRHLWTISFFALAAVFNPFVMFVSFSGALSSAFVAAGILAFTFSVYALKPQPLLSMPSITGRTPGSQSL